MIYAAVRVFRDRNQLLHGSTLSPAGAGCTPPSLRGLIAVINDRAERSLSATTPRWGLLGKGRVLKQVAPEHDAAPLALGEGSGGGDRCPLVGELPANCLALLLTPKAHPLHQRRWDGGAGGVDGASGWFPRTKPAEERRRHFICIDQKSPVLSASR